jgi:hypothetical protein
MDILSVGVAEADDGGGVTSLVARGSDSVKRWRLTGMDMYHTGQVVLEAGESELLIAWAGV